MRELERQRDKLDALFKRVESLDKDPELQAHFARYLCVLVSGFLENALEEIFGTYAEKQAAPSVANYVKSQLGNIQNPKMERILQLSGAFNPTWRKELGDTIPPEVRDAVDSVVNTRNQIAHGEQTGISYVTMQAYYEQIKKLVELLRRQCAV